MREVHRVVKPRRVESVPAGGRQQLAELCVVWRRAGRTVPLGKEEERLAGGAAERAEGAAVVEDLGAAEEGREVGAHL